MNDNKIMLENTCLDKREEELNCNKEVQNHLKEWINEIQLEELMKDNNNYPHHLLGLHNAFAGQIITAYRPYAEYVIIKDANNQDNENMLEAYNNDGFFALYMEGNRYNKYVLETKYQDGSTVVTEDPYCFSPYITELDIHLFAEGKHYQIYDKLGAHPMVWEGTYGTYFAVWAPNARRVSVVGDFNCWDGRLHPMRILGVSGIHELFIPGITEGMVYKFQIKTREDEILYKSDPYANMAQLRPGNASQVADITGYNWTDQIYNKKSTDRMSIRKKPMSIYEVHPGSWRKHEDGTEDGFYNYADLAHELADYVLDMGYTHIELMGIAEHPFDGSWGYQVTGYYAPTKRYGKPKDFMYFVNYMHEKGIGVILDWVPAHFPKDENGLGLFDGTPIYEHPDKRRGEHPDWGTYIFNYEKKEVSNFLLANALFWVEKYHIDGLRVDAVASMLYLDYGKQNGEWLPNEKGGNENYDAVHFFMHLNKTLEERHPGVLMIAEESTSWSGVTAPESMGGLGFLFKWNMGWMNDFLEYMKLDPFFRSYNHNRLTFSMQYAYSENFIQVLSHDEVVHGKCSMINKMPGEYDKKFDNLRLAYGFMYGHPGKKLLFMGQEFAQFQEWSEARSLDWYLLGEEKNRKMQEYVKALNRLYQKYDAFYINDYDSMGFEWMSCDNAEQSTVAFVRRGSSKTNQLLFICNFTPVVREKYMVGVPCGGSYVEVLNSDSWEYGGSGGYMSGTLKAKKVQCDKKNYSLELTLPPLSMICFKFNYTEEQEKAMRKKRTLKRKK